MQRRLKRLQHALRHWIMMLATSKRSNYMMTVQSGWPGVLLALAVTLSPSLAAEDFALPENLKTFDDGRMPIEQLYRQYRLLQDAGWVLEVVALSQPAGREYALPIIALRTPRDGQAVWILSGIHGEETAGPNAIAESIDNLLDLGKHKAVVLLPLNNPHGYANNWRYLNMPAYSAEADGQSVGDSSHLLLDPDHPAKARAEQPSSPEAAAITAFILQTSKTHPPVVSLDLHEDNLIDQGYVYSQGKLGELDPLAALAVQVLSANGIALKMDGATRFDEPINQGIIGPVVDGSIDELMSAATIMRDGAIQPGPHADTVLVFETPAAAIPLSQRVQAHAALLRQLSQEISAQDKTPMKVPGYIAGSQ
jgi:hypothetical protein